MGNSSGLGLFFQVWLLRFVGHDVVAVSQVEPNCRVAQATRFWVFLNKFQTFSTLDDRRQHGQCHIVPVGQVRFPRFRQKLWIAARPFWEICRASRSPVRTVCKRDADGGGICEAQSQRFNALKQHKAARMRWVFHRHGSNSFYQWQSIKRQA